MLAAVIAPFLVSSTLLAAPAPSAMQAMPEVAPKGSLLNEGKQCFSLYSDAHAGGQLFGFSFQHIEKVEHDGTPAVRIIIHQEGSLKDFSQREEFLLHADDLQPISMQSVARRNGEVIERVSLRYDEEGISGKRELASKVKTEGTPALKVSSLDVPRTGPVWEGNLRGPLFSALPLEDGAHYELPYFQHDQGFGMFDVDVLGSEMRDIGGKQVKVFFVHAGKRDGTKQNYVIADKPRKEISYSSLGIRQVPGGPEGLDGVCRDPASD